MLSARIRRLLGVAAALVLLLAGAARADVSNVVVDPTNPSNAAGARTIYAISFTTGPLGGPSAANNDHITITFPAGTDLSNVRNSQVFDTTTAPATAIGNCGFSGTTATCGLFNGQSIAAGDAVKVAINGATSPGAGSKTLTVSTTAEPLSVVSAPYTIVAANPVTNVTVDPATPSNAAGARTIYTVAFKASATGGLSQPANSRIVVTFPAGTDLSNVLNSQVFDTTAAPSTPMGNCGFNGTVATCGFFNGAAIPAGDSVKVVINGVTSPGAGSKTLTVSTTSDPSAVTSPAYTIVAANPLGHLAVDHHNPTPAAGGRTIYTITFTASATGGLSQPANSRIVVTFPAGTDLSNVLNSQVYDTTAAPSTAIGNCGYSGTVATCGFFNGASIAPGDAVRVVINGVTNPSAGDKTLTASTTSDPSPVTSTTYTIDPAQQITQPVVALTTTAPAAAPVSYTITFATSGTGALSEAANSRISLVFPSGTGLANTTTTQVFDTTAAPATQIGNCAIGGQTATCGLFNGAAIADGDAVKVVINGVANPGAGNYAVDGSTTSDPAARTSAQYGIGGPPAAPAVAGLSPT